MKITAEDPEKSKMDICAVAASPFMRRVKKEKLRVYAVTLYEINKVSGLKDLQEKPLEEVIPKEYHEFLPLFSKVIAEQLPPHRSHDHKITLQEGFTLPFGPIYSLSRTELEVLKEWIEKNLSKGFIRSSSSPCGAPVLFAPKPGGGLRLCVDYRGLNKETINNRYPLPLIQETLLRLSKARYYTKLDVRDVYNMMRITEGDEWKTAFKTHYGLFESLVMPFGLTNAPASFQEFINNTLRPFLDIFCMVFLDDILIYSNNLKEHKEHVRAVITTLKEVGLYLKVEKCEFHKEEVKYLGLIVGVNGIKMDLEQVEAVEKWEAPGKLK